MTSSKILFFLCVSFVVGIFLESIVKIPQTFVWGIFIFDVIAILVMFARQNSFPAAQTSPLGVSLRLGKELCLALGFCVLLLVIGILRMQISEYNIANDKLSEFNDKGKITLIGVVINEPDARDTTQKLKIQISNYKSVVLVTTKRYPEYKYLDKVKVIGKLEAPQNTESFNYQNYLMKDGIYSVMNFPDISALDGPRSAGEISMLQRIYSGILFCKQKLRASIQKNFLPPQSSILEGTILGDNGAMTSDLKSKLNITGLRHIISVSGTHIVILSAILMYLLLGAGLWRGQAFYFAVILICIYIALTGLPPSGVRAGIMGGTYLLSQKIGRQTMGPRLLTLACAIMLAINPLLLFYDVGFQLSFLAVLGLIYLEPVIKSLITNFTRDRAEEFVSIVSATFAAQIFTLPIMIYNFGNISYVAPIANLLILPIVPMLMIFGFLVSIAGIFSSALGWILSVPCWFLLSYFVWVIDFFSQPWMAKTLSNVSWIWVLLLYLCIVVGTAFLKKKFTPNFV